MLLTEQLLTAAASAAFGSDHFPVSLSVRMLLTEQLLTAAVSAAFGSFTAVSADDSSGCLDIT